MSRDDFKNKSIVVTGGTGSFGATFISSLINSGSEFSEIRVFSRDENKQDLMRRKFKDDRLKFYIGDVRDISSVEKATKKADYLFHAAALKQVPSSEFFPEEAIKTNIIGSKNVLDASLNNDLEAVVFLSTDKAVYPINAMGISKAMMEKVVQANARTNIHANTRIMVTRYGNVMMSRGSVIPLFLDQIKHGYVTVTNRNMTRFLMSLEDSVSLVKYALVNGISGDIFVKKAPACDVKTLIEAVSDLEQAVNLEVREIGIRHGEKLHEYLLSSEEAEKALDLGEFFRVPLDTRTLDYESYFDKGYKKAEHMPNGYSSATTVQLDAKSVAKMIQNLMEYKTRSNH